MKILLKKIIFLLLTNSLLTKVLIAPEKNSQRNLLIIPNEKKKTSNYYNKNFYLPNRYLNTHTPENKLSQLPRTNPQTTNRLLKRKNNQYRSLENSSNLKNYQTHTISTNSQNINTLVKSSIDSTETNPIIIINHQETHHIPESLETQNRPYLTKESQDTTQSMDNVSIQDLPILEQILENLGNIYTNFYAKLPENAEQGSIDDVGEMNGFIIKLKTFTRDVIMNSGELMNDINFLQRKIHLIKSGENEMIYFYNLEQKYGRLKTQSALMLKPKIREKWQEINEFSHNYNEEIKNLYKDSYELYKFNLSFANQIKKINYSHNNNAQNNALNKFDEVLMFSIKLIEVKVDLEKSLRNLKNSFEEIKMIGFKVDELLMDLGNIINDREVEIKKEEVKMEEVKLKETNVGKVSGVRILGAVVVFMVFW